MFFDASAIVSLAASTKRSSLQGGSTLSLAEYEVGNMIWNRVSNLKVVDQAEGFRLMEAFISLLGLMGRATAFDRSQALRIAVAEKITYYDAAYIVGAMEERTVLVTDDVLQRRAGARYLKTIGSSEV